MMALDATNWDLRAQAKVNSRYIRKVAQGITQKDMNLEVRQNKILFNYEKFELPKPFFTIIFQCEGLIAGKAVPHALV